MAEQLESWCQSKLAELLLQKEYLLKRKREETLSCNLPHYKTLLEMYKAIEKQELFLLETTKRIETLRRQKEISSIKKAMSAAQLTESAPGETSNIREWRRQMLLHNKGRGIDGSVTADFSEENEHFYDIGFEEECSGKEKLSWSTRYRGRCTRISVGSTKMCRSTDPSDYSFSASFYVDRLTERAGEFIAGGKTAQEFVESVVWAGLQELIDIS